MIVAALGAVAGGVGSRLVDNRFNTIKLVLNTILADNERLRREQELNADTINNLQNRLNKQELHLITLDSSHFNHPWPSWIKDVEGNIIFINKSYEEIFLKPRGFSRFDYVGKTDYAVWPKEIADAFSENDRTVKRTKERWEGIEKVGTNGSSEDYWIIKYPIIYNREVIGVAGMSVPVNKIMNYNNS